MRAQHCHLPARAPHARRSRAARATVGCRSEHAGTSRIGTRAKVGRLTPPHKVVESPRFFMPAESHGCSAGRGMDFSARGNVIAWMLALPGGGGMESRGCLPGGGEMNHLRPPQVLAPPWSCLWVWSGHRWRRANGMGANLGERLQPLVADAPGGARRRRMHGARARKMRGAQALRAHGATRAGSQHPRRVALFGHFFQSHPSGISCARPQICSSRRSGQALRQIQALGCPRVGGHWVCLIPWFRSFTVVGRARIRRYSPELLLQFERSQPGPQGALAAAAWLASGGAAGGTAAASGARSPKQPCRAVWWWPRATSTHCTMAARRRQALPLVHRRRGWKAASLLSETSRSMQNGVLGQAAGIMCL